MRLPFSRAALSTLAAALALGAGGCRPDIGESCSNSIECSSQGDRICDTSLPDGYCTVYNCEADRCPDDAICVAFNSSDAPVCQNEQAWRRLERTFCLGECANDGDCRDGYQCARGDDLKNRYGATILDRDPSEPGVCVSRGARAPQIPDGVIPPGAGPDDAVCGPASPAFPDYGAAGMS
ncbi:MAG TPA: hypothetical protein VFS00_16600, partial [Polyangiaceae bacterium]|nr:hypothetical protein [Polyangiaceae bacterium]